MFERKLVMAVRYTAHAREQMQRRSVSEAEVEAVLPGPDIRYSGRNGNPVLIRWVSGRRLKVVVAHDDPELVITIGD
jgi:hypothetical protein